MGEEKTRPISLGLCAKRARLADVGRDFVIKNVVLDEGARMKIL
jgi:hypothetical protein